jgi:hypothetical protein
METEKHKFGAIPKDNQPETFLQSAEMVIFNYHFDNRIRFDDKCGSQSEIFTWKHHSC